jgi:hypothetical protein
MKLSWLLGLVAAVGFASLAEAATVKTFKAGTWDASVHAEDGVFTHCAASAVYKSGIAVIFSIDKSFSWVVAFSHRNWKYEIGETYPVAFTVDDMKPLTARATAYTTSAVRIQLKDSAELFARFKQGRVLRVATARKTVFEFNLTGTNEMLAVLLDCAGAKGGLKSVPMVSNPFGTSSASAPSQSPPRSAPPPQLNDAAFQAEATALAANLLSAADMTGYRMMETAEVPQMKGDVRWIIPSKEAIGSIRIFPSMDKEEQRAIGGQLIADDAKECRGKFASGSMPEDDKGGTARAFTVCEAGSGPITMYYFTVPRSRGGAYVIATGSFGEAARAKEQHEEFRSAAYRFLRK